MGVVTGIRPSFQCENIVVTKPTSYTVFSPILISGLLDYLQKILYNIL